jgi:hypothetical protein
MRFKKQDRIRKIFWKVGFEKNLFPIQKMADSDIYFSHLMWRNTDNLGTDLREKSLEYQTNAVNSEDRLSYNQVEKASSLPGLNQVRICNKLFL